MRAPSKALAVVAAVLLLAGAGRPHRVPTIRCKGDQVVWVNTRTGIYHPDGDRWFGATKDGRFMCEKDAKRAGFRMTMQND